MRQFFVMVLLIATLPGCAMLERVAGKPAPKLPEPTPVETAESGVVPSGAVPTGARTVEEFDTTSAAQRAAAVAGVEKAAGERDLGRTIASLGSPTEPGFWLKTPLVSEPARGRVEYAETGSSVVLDLIPIEGAKTAGSRISLAALRLLGAPLTGLPEVRVFLVKN